MAELHTFSIELDEVFADPQVQHLEMITEPAEVLGEIGLDASEIDRLAAAGVIALAPPAR